MKLEKKVQKAVEEFGATLSSYSDDPYVRASVMKLALRDFAWLMVDKDGFNLFEEDVAEQLSTMADLVRERGSNGA